MAVPASSLIAKPWPRISPETSLWLAKGLYSHRCPGPTDAGTVKSDVVVCLETPPQDPRSKKERLPRVPVGFESYPMRIHEGPYIADRGARTAARSMSYFAFVALRRSLGNTRHPWIWFFLRQTVVIAPLVAIAGAAGQSLLIAQVMIVSALARLLTRGFRFQIWVAGYHFRACPAPEAFVSVRTVDMASTGAAVLEASPLLVGGLVLWPFLAPDGGSFQAFAAAVAVATLVTVLVVAVALPVLSRIYENDHPDVRPVVSFSMVIVFALGMFLYSPLTVLTIPSALHTVVQCLPWTPWMFLPLSVGAAAPPVWTLAVSALLTIAMCIVLFAFGRGLRLSDPSGIEGDDLDDDDDDSPRGARR